MAETTHDCGELGGLQGLVEPEEQPELDGLNDGAWGEGIGNAVRPLATQPIASMVGKPLLHARVGEVLALRRADLSDEGVLLRRTKGSKSELTRWSDRLREAVREAQALHRGVISPYLLHGANGEPATYSAVRSAFVRALGKAEEASPPLRRRFTVHDIKAKGITDHKNHHGGHRSARMRDVYVRKAEEVDSTR